MSTNLVASIAKLLNPDVLSRVASVLGVDQSAIEKAASAGVPGLLAAFISLVGKPGGAAKLADVVGQQRPDLLSNIGNAGLAGQRDMMDSGISSLSSLLGGSTLTALTSALSRYAGIGDTGTKGVLGLLGPLALGVLGQQQRASGLDASGLAQMLQSQSSNIARALPPGVARQLSDAGIFDQVTSMPSKGRMREEPSQWNWLAPALAVLALGALAWYFLGRNPEQTVAQLPATNVEAPMQAGQAHDFIVTAAEEKGWIGRPVFSHDNQKVGEVVEIKRGPDDKVTDIYFDAGADLGVGAKRYHITTHEIEQMRPDGVVVTLKETDVKALPEAPDNKMGQ
jgi:hypothetical protein